MYVLLHGWYFTQSVYRMCDGKRGSTHTELCEEYEDDEYGLWDVDIPGIDKYTFFTELHALNLIFFF